MLTPEYCVEATERLLLDRKPTLWPFDIAVISRCFPTFEHERPRYISQS